MSRETAKLHYWSPTFNPKTNLSYAEAEIETRRLVGESVRLRLRSDVPLGVFLSGRVDSSVVAYEAAQVLGSDLQCFTVSTGGELDESNLAAETARTLGVQHHVLPLRLDPAEGLQTVVQHYDQPFADSSAMHVATTRRHYTTADGQTRIYEAHLLRRSFRDGGKVRNETLANLSPLPPAAIEAVRAVLRGQPVASLGAPQAAVECVASRPHGHVAAVWTVAGALGLPELLGPPGRSRDLALALVIARVVAPGSKLATIRWWTETTLAADLGVADAGTDEVYAALDWLVDRQPEVEAALARRHLTDDGLALYDLSSSWVTGRCCPLAAIGHSRDGRRGTAQIEYGLLTDPRGRPVAVQVFAGNTADPTAFTHAVTTVRDRFGLRGLHPESPDRQDGR